MPTRYPAASAASCITPRPHAASSLSLPDLEFRHDDDQHPSRAAGTAVRRHLSHARADARHWRHVLHLRSVGGTGQTVGFWLHGNHGAASQRPPSRLNRLILNTRDAMNTFFALMAQYGTAHIPVEKCADLFGMSSRKACEAASRQRLPVPAFRIGSQKSPWLVDAQQLAQHLDKLKKTANEDWDNLRA